MNDLPADEGLNETALADLMIRYQQADAAAAEKLVGRLSPLLLRFPSSTPRGIAKTCYRSAGSVYTGHGIPTVIVSASLGFVLGKVGIGRRDCFKFE